jgi:hypothetical protein
MGIKISDALANDLLDGLSLDAQLNGGFISIYAGTVPTTADAALDCTVTTGVHTLLCKIGSDAVPVDDATTGLNFAAAAASRAIAKSGSETWAGKVQFLGKDQAAAGVSPLTATFYRFHTAADTTGEFGGSAAGGSSTPRIQGTVGTSGADLNLTSVSLSDNGSNTVGIATYEVRIDA